MWTIQIAQQQYLCQGTGAIMLLLERFSTFRSVITSFSGKNETYRQYYQSVTKQLVLKDQTYNSIDWLADKHLIQK